MSGNHRSEKSHFLSFGRVGVLLLVLVLAGLYLTSHVSYLLFHSLAELFSVVVAAGVFIVAWNTRRVLQNKYLLFVGITYLAVGSLDLVHTLAYKGMGVFPGGGSNLATQLWIASRYTESLSLLAAPLFLGRRLRPGRILGAYAVLTAVLLAAIFGGLFPVCYVEGSGLTPFKKTSEYLISAVLLGAFGALYGRRKEFEPRVFQLLSASIFLTVGAELAFTFYINVYGLSNLIGHYFKLLSFVLVYVALIKTGLEEPYELLYRDLARSEQERREGEERFRAIADYTYDWESWLAPDGRLLWVNPAVQRMTGYGTAECLSMQGYPLPIVQKEDRLRLGRELRSAITLKTSANNVQFRVRHKDGTLRWVSASWQPIYDAQGRYRGIRSSGRDISEVKEAEEALEKSEAKYRSLFENMTDGFAFHEIVTDQAGKPVDYVFLEVNGAFEKLTGLRRRDVVGRRVTEVMPGIENEPADWIDSYGKVALTGQEARFERYAEKLGRWYAVTAYSPAPGKFATLFEDVTAHKLAQEALREYAEELQSYSERLKQSNRELEDFAYIASHDLQEPLRKVVAFGGRLRERYEEALDEKGRDYLDRMLRASERMQQLINDLLRLSRVTTKARPFGPVDLHGVAVGVLSDLEEHISRTGAEVQLGDLPRVQADAVQMRQLLQNLLTNALKFHRRGVRPRVKIGATIEDGHAVVTVADNGIGFDEKYADRIFRPFQRLHGRGQYEGSGMGLSICKKILERHGGRITARSRPGEGATFFVQMSLAREEDKEAAHG
jgi:PAS domain S-box-containing protein